MKFSCLVLDHDDTAVDSTPDIHYPSYIHMMEALRPGSPILTLDEWYSVNFDPGIAEFLSKELGLSDEEMKIQFSMWQNYTRNRIPRFFDGFIQFLKRFRSNGGIIAKVSHSEKEIIEKHYKHYTGEVFPDVIFGWDHDKEKRKPSTYPITQILQQFNVSKEDLLIVDDLKPGVIMAKNSGVKIAGVGWSHQVPLIRDYMKRECDFYVKSIQELETIVFGE